MLSIFSWSQVKIWEEKAFRDTILYYKIHPSICNLHAITLHPWCNGKYKPLSLYHPFFFLVPANTEEIETRRSLRAIKHWRHFLLPRLLLQFFVFFLSCSLFIVSLGFCKKFALQKLSILIIQFTKLILYIIYSPLSCLSLRHLRNI